jgi:hypothetical protein
MKNGRGDDHHYDDPKIASISEARRKAEAARKTAAKQSAGPPGRTIGQIVTGGIIVAMAVGMLVWWGRSLMQSLSFAP